MIPDETLSQERRMQNSSVLSQSDGGTDGAELGDREGGVKDEDRSFVDKPPTSKWPLDDIDVSQGSNESLVEYPEEEDQEEDDEEKKMQVGDFVLAVEMGKEDDGKNETHEELDV